MYLLKIFKALITKRLMNRMNFDSQGKLIGVDGKITKREDEEDNGSFSEEELRKTENRVWKKVDNSGDTEYWSLYRNGKRLEPLKFSNGKTQEDIVREVVGKIKEGKKIIFLHGMCGTGKSAVALNIARVLGKTSIVVPIKSLQRQYEEDYMKSMQVVKKNKEELRIAMITGRDNHDSIYMPGLPCSDPSLPDTIPLVEKNAKLLREYYKENPLVKHKEIDNIKKLRRISIAPANPYWSPIIPEEYEVQLSDAEKKRYLGLRGREFIFYHRKRGCSYYDQYQSYIDADAIIFNSAKYKIEVVLDRKPETKVDIIDEADEFLDSFSSQVELNLTRLSNALKSIMSEDPDVMAVIDTIRELISLEEKNKRALGVNEEQIFPVGDTTIGKIIKLLLKDRNLESEISLDDLSYANKGIEAAKDFVDFLDDTYLTYKKYEDSLFLNLVAANLSKRLNEIIDKGKSFVFMSGTIHSENVLKEIFGIKEYDIVEAETMHQGEIEIVRTGKEFDCSYKNFKNGSANREMYLKALSSSLEKAKKPLLVHVNAFEDLPSLDELNKYNIKNVLPREKLSDLQFNDKTGKLISSFKKKLSDSLYSTKCSRGIDFPGDICNSMIFTKYPNPNVQGTFWKVLERTHSKYYWDFYKDKARREFLQRIYRALRSKDDHVYILSPDARVLDAVRNIQISNI